MQPKIPTSKHNSTALLHQGKITTEVSSQNHVLRKKPKSETGIVPIKSERKKTKE